MTSSDGSHLQQLPITSQQIDSDFHITCHAFSTFLKFAPLKGHIQIISYFTCRRKITVSQMIFHQHSTFKWLSGVEISLSGEVAENWVVFFYYVIHGYILLWYIDKWPWTLCLQCSSIQYCCTVCIYVRHIPLYTLFILYNLGRTTKMFLLPIHTS